MFRMRTGHRYKYSAVRSGEGREDEDEKIDARKMLKRS